MGTSRFVFTGGRSFKNDSEGSLELLLHQANLDNTEWWDNEVLIQHGGAVGADTLFDKALRQIGWDDEDITVVRPDYDKFPPKYAPIERNKRMLAWGVRGDFSCLVALMDEDAVLEKGGTGRTIKEAIELGFDSVMIYRYGDKSKENPPEVAVKH